MSIAICPNGCAPETDTPFYYPPCCTGEELGVLVYADLSISDRWSDGVVGVPEDIRGLLEWHEMPQCVECHQEATYTD